MLPNRSLRILVVDDNVINAKLLRRTLEGAGHTVDVVLDAPSALVAMEQRAPDVALVDVQLPGIDGLTLIRRAREGAATRDLPILVVSASATTDDRRRALEAGADDFVGKPVDTRAIVAQVAELVARAR